MLSTTTIHPDPADVEDVLQETLLTLHRARHTWDPARKFEPWLYAIARNTTVDWFRRERQRNRFEQPAAGDDAIDPGSEHGDRELAVDDVLSGLPRNQRDALEMVKLEGLSIEEAAARAGVTEGALRVRIHRGYRALRAKLLGEPE